ncbi:MAG TPA: hypothetical protein VGD60_15175 [Candidatus Acidoferrales bacterium]
MRPTKFSAPAVLIAVTIILALAGCSSSSSSSNSSSGSFAGKWAFELEQNGAAPNYEIDTNFTQTGSAVTSDAGNTIDGFGCTNLNEAPSDMTSGTVNGSTFNLTFTIHSGQPDAQTLTLTGTLTNAGGKQIDGTYAWSTGPCNSLQTGIFTAASIGSLTGQYGGVLINGANVSDTITGMVTEDSDFTTSASITVMNNSCLSAISPSANIGGYSVGRLTSFYGTAGSNTVAFAGATTGPAATIDGVWSVVPGCANQAGGTFDFYNVAKSGQPAAQPAAGTSTAAALQATPSPDLLKNFAALVASRHNNP